MSPKEKATTSSRKCSKPLCFLVLLIISFGACQTAQDEETEKPTTKETEVPLVATNKAQKETLQLSEEKITDPNAISGTFTDNRDGQNYPWVRLKDGKKWMAKNLNYQTTNTWCYNDNQDNCTKYGRLYTWQSASNACPNGWRLPTDEEWWTMTSFYGKAYNSYPGQQKMEGKDDGEIAYQALIQGELTGFTALFGGSYATNEGFDYLGDLGCYWTGSANNESNALGYYFYIHSRGLARDSYPKGSGFSCRCLQD